MTLAIAFFISYVVVNLVRTHVNSRSKVGGRLSWTQAFWTAAGMILVATLAVTIVSSVLAYIIAGALTAFAAEINGKQRNKNNTSVK